MVRLSRGSGQFAGVQFPATGGTTALGLPAAPGSRMRRASAIASSVNPMAIQPTVP